MDEFRELISNISAMRDKLDEIINGNGHKGETTVILEADILKLLKGESDDF